MILFFDKIFQLFMSIKGSINEASIYKKAGDKSSVFKFAENIQLALKAAKNIGVVVVNVDVSMISDGRPNQIFGLLWQIMYEPIASFLTKIVFYMKKMNKKNRFLGKLIH